MFDRHDQRYLTGNDWLEVVQTMQSGVTSWGVIFEQWHATGWTGKFNTNKWGVIVKIHLSALPAPGGYTVSTRLTLDFDSSGMILLILSWFLCWPLAMVFFFLAYQEFQSREVQITRAMWGTVANRLASNAGPYG